MPKTAKTIFEKLGYVCMYIVCTYTYILLVLARSPGDVVFDW